jgi:hypothetical protein
MPGASDAFFTSVCLTGKPGTHVILGLPLPLCVALGDPVYVTKPQVICRIEYILISGLFSYLTPVFLDGPNRRAWLSLTTVSLN